MTMIVNQDIEFDVIKVRCVRDVILVLEHLLDGCNISNKTKRQAAARTKGMRRGRKHESSAGPLRRRTRAAGHARLAAARRCRFGEREEAVLRQIRGQPCCPRDSSLGRVVEGPLCECEPLRNGRRAIETTGVEGRDSDVPQLAGKECRPRRVYQHSYAAKQSEAQ